MEFVYIIGFVILFVIVSRQSNRIGEIEGRLKNLGSFSPVKPQENSSPVVSAQMPTQSVQPQIGKQEDGQVEVPVRAEESSGRLLGGIGIAAVIVGISFFLKYAFDNNWIGPTGRVMIGIIAGLALLGIGQFLRKKYVNYSDFLMGGGIAVLYLSIFSAQFFYHLISPTMAGVFMFFVTALGFVISIVNATTTLAIVSAVGGFTTPFLAHTGANDMFALFSYLTILNVGVLAVSFFKKWPALIIVAFVGSLANFHFWYKAFYDKNLLGPTLLFCFISFLTFLLASVARAITGKAKADQLNYILLGVNAFIFATTSYTLLNGEFHSMLGFAAVFVAAIFMVVAFVVNKFNPEDVGLNIFLPGLAVTFLSLAVPLQFSGNWIAVAWLVESVFLYAIASFISNRGFQVMGLVVYILGLVNLFFWNFPSAYSKDFTPVFNSHFIISVLALVIAYIIAFVYRRFGSVSVDIQKRGILVFVIIANVLTIYAVSSQIVFYHNARLVNVDVEYQADSRQADQFNTGYDVGSARSDLSTKYYVTRSSIQNRSNTWVSIFLTIYAAILTAIGFGMRKVTARRMGLVLFIVTAFKVFFDVWSLGQIYRIVSFIVFGVVALAASFAYSKYKNRLKEIV